MTPRIALERELLVRLLGARDLATLRRWLLGLRLLGLDGYLVGEHGRILCAIAALAGRGARVDVESVSRESGGRVNPDYVAWVATAYQSETPLAALATALLHAHRRAKGDSIGAVLRNAMRDPAVDVDRAIAAAVGALRRLAHGRGGVEKLARGDYLARTPARARMQRDTGGAPIVVRPGGLRVRRVASGGAWPR